MKQISLRIQWPGDYYQSQLSFLILDNQQNKMNNNPQLHYLQHVQNTSISKHCSKFAKAPRFLEHRRTYINPYQAKFIYQPRTCSFGFGQRSKLINKKECPSPNTYNISKFPCDKRSTSIGFSREDAIFGTITVEINQKAKLPAPGAYQSNSSLKSRKFTLRKRLRNEFDRKNRQKVPQPGQYQVLGINKEGKYPISTVKNVRFVFVDCYKQKKQAKLQNTGPGSYDIQKTTSDFSSLKVQKMKSTSIRPFGTQKRRGPQQMHRIFVPGPGMYDTFSAFGEDKQTKTKFYTEY